MLLPSALSCDSSSTNAPRTRFQQSLFASPPLSPPPSSSSSSHPAINNIYSTCRVLQSMLTNSNQLPSPPTQHLDVPPSPAAATSRLRLRSRNPSSLDEAAPFTPRKKITKRTAYAVPPRGLNKRRRALDDDMSRNDVAENSWSSSDDDVDEEEEEPTTETSGPSTPKRMRLAPEIIPLGLERADFHDLHLRKMEQQTGEKLEESVEGNGNDEWSTEEDRMLVELVLEKLKLTKSEWQDCARSLGKDRGCVGRRWKSLMGAGEVGLKRNHLHRRGRIHGTWR